MEVNSNNIKSLEISDGWKSELSKKNNRIDIQLNGYIGN